MRRIIIDGKNFDGINSVHDFLQKELGFPDYYGKNLDALYDCLGEITEDIEIEFINFDDIEDRLGWKSKVLMYVFSDAADSNGHIKLISTPDVLK